MAFSRNRGVGVVVAGAVVSFGTGAVQAAPLVFEDFNPAGTGTGLIGTTAAATAPEMGLTGSFGNDASDYIPDNPNNAAEGDFMRTASEATNGTTIVYPTNTKFAAPAGGSAVNTSGNYGYNAVYANMSKPIALSGTAAAGGTTWFSYLLANGATGNADYESFLYFENSASGNKYYDGFGYGKEAAVSVQPDSTLPQSGLPGMNTYNASGGTFATAGFTGGTLGFVLGELTTTASGADTLSVLVLPYTAGGTAAIPNSPAGVTFNATFAFTAPDATADQLGVFSAGVDNPEFDAIRVGTTYADAVGAAASVPEPVSAGTLAVGSIGLLLRHRRRSGH